MTEGKYNISSPGYPKPVKDNITCLWVITLPPGHNTSVNIVKFDLDIAHAKENNDTM